MKKDRVQSCLFEGVGADTLEDVLFREWVQEQEAIARRLMETGQLLLKHTELSKRLYQERVRRLRVQ